MIQEDFEALNMVLDEFPPDLVGICYDAGHGKINRPRAIDWMHARRDRLIAVHLHDNNGVGDQHLPPFDGTADWTELARIITDSAYIASPLNMEVGMRNTAFETPEAFLTHAFAAGQKLLKLL